MRIRNRKVPLKYVYEEKILLLLMIMVNNEFVNPTRRNKNNSLKRIQNLIITSSKLGKNVKIH